MDNKKTKEQIDKDFEELLAMSKTGQVGISISEFIFTFSFLPFCPDI